MGGSIVVMGVSGCGKSSLAAALAAALGRPLVEGDDHHSAANRDKMSRGIALDDADRAQWLDTLASRLADAPEGIVLTCSALKRAYRERLRAAAPGLRFVFLRIGFDEARRRVAARRHLHFFSPQLVRNQFDTLEAPDGEPGVLAVDATLPIDALQRDVLAWLAPSGA